MEKRKTYAELLRSPLWQKKRLEIFERDNFTCQYCGNTESELQVHHKVYHEGLNPWEYSNHELITLCELCHSVETITKRNLYKLFMDTCELSRECGFSEQLISSLLLYVYDELVEIKNAEQTKTNDSIISNVVFRYPMLSDAKILSDNGFLPTHNNIERINKYLPDFFTKYSQIYGSRIDK